ncbi:transcriptional regulator [Trinickia symbiotica]|uniref:Bacterial transcriptional activator domain-containing protein n=1 Tax=Trinickia symbiotica TaxID=863227 RepID=A0A2N7WSI6_9BURK|nr:AAA family ATPase [Trinickia symbiotica]PMS32245.1 hypothetical protein C0Z20_26725 [Trinickia symbiotica]PPK45195.1 transcriptional regulator [Trinickia symbiotica]
MSASMIEICLLGGCRLYVDGREVDLRYDKVRLLLAWLAMEPGVPQRRERLASRLWPDADGDAARRSLRHAIHVLRAALGTAHDRLEGDRQTLLLAADGWRCDALALAAAQTRFARELNAAEDIVALEQAASLYGGEFLAGVDAAEDSELEAWLRDQRDAAASRAAQLWRRLAALRQASGMMREAMSATQRLIELAPLDEPANRTYMEALAEIDGIDAALAHYASFCRRLMEESDAEPDAKTQSLAARLRAKAAPEAVLPERRPIALLCAQLVDYDPDGASTCRDGPTFSSLLDLVRQRIGDGTARLVVPHEGLALVHFGVPLALEESALAAARLAVELSGHAGLSACLVQAIHCAVPTMSVSATGQEPPGGFVNAALRLCALGHGGEILASAEAASWLRRDLDRRGGESFRLIPHPQHAELVVVRPRARRARPRGDDLELPLVGRRAELAQLLRYLRAARRIATSVAVVGEVGLGKTRLAYEVVRHARRRSLAVWLRCSRETVYEPLAPLRSWIGALIGAAPGVRDARALKRLARLERRWRTEGLLAELFAPAMEGEAEGIAATPASLSGTFARLMAMAAAAAGARGLTLVIDDVQWADETTCELLDQWLANTSVAAFTLLLAREPGNVPVGVPVMQPPRLDDAASRDLLGLASPQRPMTRAEAEAGLRLAEGLPLFLVELKRHWAGIGFPQRDLLLGSGAQRPAHGRGTQVAEAARRGVELPRNLHDLLAARLDRLSPKLRRLAGSAAVLGNEGDIVQLSRVVDEPPAQLLPQFARFVEAGLLYPLEHGAYQFRHQALHRAALERLPLDERRALHGRAAERLADCLPAARVAWHWESAGEPGKAMLAHVAAGRQAFLQGAQRDAISHFDSALMHGALQRIEGATMLSAWMGKGLALVELEGYGSQAASDCFREAQELAEASGDLEMRLQVEWGLWLPSSSRVGHRGALHRHSRVLIELATRHGDAAWLAAGHQAMGNNLYFIGRFAEAEPHLRLAAEFGESPGMRRRILERVGQASDIYALGFLLWIACKQGEPAAIDAALTRALTAADQLRNPAASSYLYGFTAIAMQICDRPGEALTWTARVRAIAEARGYDLWIAVAVMIENWARVRLGMTVELYGLEATLDAVDVAMPSVAVIFLIPYIDALRHLERYADALAAFDRAMSIVRRYRDRQGLDTLWRLRAACLDGLGTAKARADAEKSRARAQRIRACQLGLARKEAVAA